MREPCRELSGTHARFRRLSLPGVSPHGRRGEHRSGVRTGTASRRDRRGARAGGRRGMGASRELTPSPPLPSRHPCVAVCNNRAMRVAATRSAIVLALLVTVDANPAAARTFQVGEVEGTANLEISYGLLARVEDRDPDLIAIVNGGNATSANYDDGDLNYGAGIVSNMLQGSLELDARWSFLGAYARGLAFYDFETELIESRAHGPDPTVPSVTWARTSRFPSTTSRPTSAPAACRLHLRVGNQILNWGESTFLASACETATPLDIVAGLRPASSARDVEIPQGMLWAAANVTETLAVEAFYQYEWQRVRRLRSAGSSPTTTSSASMDWAARCWAPGSSRIRAPTSTTLFRLPAGTLGFDPRLHADSGRRARDEPSEPGPGRLHRCRLIVPRLNSTKLAFHFMNYHSRLPIVNAHARTLRRWPRPRPRPSPHARPRSRRSTRAKAFRRRRPQPPPRARPRRSRSASTRAQRAISAEYPENIQMIGVSFNTTTLRTGTLFSGEVAHHFGLSVPDPSSRRLRHCALRRSSSIRASGRASSAASDRTRLISASMRLDKTQVEFGIRQLLGPRLGASQTILGVDFGYVHVHDMPANESLRLTAPGMNGPSDFDRLPDADCVRLPGARSAQLRRRLRRLTVQPSVAWLHDVERYDAGARRRLRRGPQGLQRRDRRRLHQHVAACSSSYTNLFGAGRFNLVNDRDFVRFQLTYFY